MKLQLSRTFNLNKTQSLNDALRAVYMEEEGGISWPLVEESEINPISCFPTHTDSKNSLYYGISKLHGPGPKIRWRNTYNSLWTKLIKWGLEYFVQSLHALLMVALKCGNHQGKLHCSLPRVPLVCHASSRSNGYPSCPC